MNKKGGLFFIKIINLLIIALALGLFVWKRSFFPAKLPLFYSLPWGREQLANKNFLLILPGFSILIYFLNLIISKFFGKEENLLIISFLTVASLFFAFLCFFAEVKIILLMT